jgi:hypothetical protein
MDMLRHGFVCAGLSIVAGFLLSPSAWSAAPLLLRNPALSQDKIAFFYADDIWVVAREGGEAVAIVLQQLKEHPVIEPVVPPYPNYHEHDGLGMH